MYVFTYICTHEDRKFSDNLSFSVVGFIKDTLQRIYTCTLQKSVAFEKKTEFQIKRLQYQKTQRPTVTRMENANISQLS